MLSPNLSIKAGELQVDARLFTTRQLAQTLTDLLIYIFHPRLPSGSYTAPIGSGPFLSGPPPRRSPGLSMPIIRTGHGGPQSSALPTISTHRNILTPPISESRIGISDHNKRLEHRVAS